MRPTVQKSFSAIGILVVAAGFRGLNGVAGLGGTKMDSTTSTATAISRSFATTHVLRSALFFLVVFAAVVTGCGQRHGTVPVRGMVRFQDEPLAGATVIFRTTQERDDRPLLASATTGEDGRFSLVSQFGPREVANGALVGKYAVIISKFVPPPGVSPEKYQQLVEIEARAVEDRGFATPKETAPPKVELLPPRYSNPSSTTLRADVSLGGENEFNFDLQE